LPKGFIITDQSGFFKVQTEDGALVVCRLRGRLLEVAESSDIAAVGDRVEISLTDDKTGMIEVVEPRTSVLSRAVRTEGKRGAGGAEREHVIVANAEQVLLVVSAKSPPFNPRLLDRFLVVAEKSTIPHVVIVVNKCDLATPTDDLNLYQHLGYRMLQTSAVTGEGVAELRDLLKDRLSVFTGPSGVGKSSLLNALQPGLARAVKSVSIHTTRDSELIKIDSGGYLADTPGIRTLDIWDVDPEELDAYFVEIAPLVERCRFNDCTHQNEPGCAVVGALKQGHIHKSRYTSYLKLRAELEERRATVYS
jgi:ribosome biogenesis GTPase / thiamine phosphate phosphatase